MDAYGSHGMATGAARPYSFSGASTASDSSDAYHHLQRPITSRFVEGSMNDRSSRAPPVSFLGAAAPANPAPSRNSEDEQRGFGYNFTRRSLQMARPSFSSFRGGSSATPANSNSATASASSTATTSSTSSSIATTNSASTTATTSTAATTTSTLRRPRSFLAPFWDGVAKRLHRRARSTLETDLAKKKEEVGDTDMKDQQCEPPQPNPQPNALPTLSDRPSPDEVFANYQQLMQAGFFTKRAIPATRQGLSGSNGSNGSSSAAAATPDNTPALSSPGRYPLPPPCPSFLANGTPLSPVAPSPAATPMTTTPRGTKRIRVDAENDGRNDNDTAFKNVSIIAASDAPLSSPTRTPRKVSKKLRKTSGRLPGGETLRSAAASESASASSNRPLTARATRSSQNPQNAHVHQTLPPMPAPVSFAPATGPEAAVMVSDTSSHRAAAKMRMETGPHRERRRADVVATEPAALEESQEPRKKRRSQGPAVVHQVQQEASFGSSISISSDSDSTVMIYDEEATKPLRPPPMTHYHRPLGPRNPIAANRGSSNSRRAPRKNALASPASAASSALDEQGPISFHYPQRVRPMQAQVVEVKASSASHRRKRSDAPAADDDHASPLQARYNSGRQNKPATRSSRGKTPLLSGDDAENQIPVWQN